MFMYCYDEKLKKQLLDKGYKLMKETDKYSLFAYDPNIDFHVDKFSTDKLYFSKKLTFG